MPRGSAPGKGLARRRLRRGMETKKMAALPRWGDQVRFEAENSVPIVDPASKARPLDKRCRGGCYRPHSAWMRTETLRPRHPYSPAGYRPHSAWMRTETAFWERPRPPRSYRPHSAWMRTETACGHAARDASGYRPHSAWMRTETFSKSGRRPSLLVIGRIPRGCGLKLGGHAGHCARRRYRPHSAWMRTETTRPPTRVETM